MELKQLLDFKKGSIISIAGAGGKSSFMYTLAEELKGGNKCLVTTTTKIFVPDKTQYDYITTEADEFSQLDRLQQNGVYVYGSSISRENKLVGISCEELEKHKTYFDYILIEADGSKRKPIKGWNSNEPVICKYTSATVGILSIESLGKEINEDNVHRTEEFLTLTNSKLNDEITIGHYVDLIFHPRGLFKNSLGEKVLFINKVEDYKQQKNSELLLNEINIRNKKIGMLNKIIIGSLKLKHYKMQRND